MIRARPGVAIVGRGRLRRVAVPRFRPLRRPMGGRRDDASRVVDDAALDGSQPRGDSHSAVDAGEDSLGRNAEADSAWHQAPSTIERSRDLQLVDHHRGDGTFFDMATSTDVFQFTHDGVDHAPVREGGATELGNQDNLEEVSAGSMGFGDGRECIIPKNGMPLLLEGASDWDGDHDFDLRNGWRTTISTMARQVPGMGRALPACETTTLSSASFTTTTRCGRLR